MTGSVHLIANTSGLHSGISRYCDELYKHLQGRAPVRLCSFRSLPLTNHLTFLEHLPLGVVPDERQGIYHFTRIMGCALMLWRPLRPAVATVHDLGSLVWKPEYQSSGALDRFLFWLSLQGLKKMDRIIADSCATARSVIDLLGISAGRVKVVHLGVDQDVFRRVRGARGALQQKYNLPDQPGVYTVLYVGSESARKNLVTLLEALASFKSKGMVLRLIKVGGAGHPSCRAVFLGHVARLGMGENVTIVGEVPDADLPLFYSGADVFVLPSYVEGFGLPVLEAMACGTPVVCSNAGALPEVVGDAAMVVRPDDVVGYVDAIARILGDSALSERLVQKGTERCSLFPWYRAAEETAAVYNDTL
ncbi:MAG: glycosyltransferase family 4 protein [Thermoflexales bacterium]|nr:glycosyltransferase family 4 protein [Thermoflexales bacterium]